MTEYTSKDNNLHLVKWPFYIGDGLLVLLAFFIVAYSAKPLSSTAISWCVISITFGALVFVAPFVLEYLHSIRLAKNQLQEVVDRQLQSLDTILQELDALTVTLSSLAQKSANSTEKMEQFGFEFKKQLKQNLPHKIRKSINLKDVETLLKSGAHFGHPTSKWNPNFKKYIVKSGQNYSYFVRKFP